MARAVTQNARVAIASALTGAALCWTLLSFIPWHRLEVLKHVAAFPSCSAARAVGVAPSYRGRPGYWSKHDADNDGIACENFPGRRISNGDTTEIGAAIDHAHCSAPPARGAVPTSTSPAWTRSDGSARERRSINPHFHLAAALALLGRVEEARTAAQTGLAFDPSFTIRRFQRNLSSDNQTFLAKRERIYEGMRLAGVPEG